MTFEEELKQADEKFDLSMNDSKLISDQFLTGKDLMVGAVTLAILADFIQTQEPGIMHKAMTIVALQKIRRGGSVGVPVTTTARGNGVVN